jgi:hypothetical protein
MYQPTSPKSQSQHSHRLLAVLWRKLERPTSYSHMIAWLVSDDHRRIGSASIR